LAFPGPLADEERGEDGLGGERRGVVVGDRDAQILRRAAEALQRHGATHRLEQGIEPRAIGIGPRRSERGHRRIDEPWVQRVEPLVTDAEAVGHTGPHVLHEHVGAFGELLNDLAPCQRLEVDGDRAFAAVPAVEAGQLAEGVTGQGLDLRHAGAHVGQHHAGVGAGDVAGEVDDGDAVERAGH